MPGFCAFPQNLPGLDPVSNATVFLKIGRQTLDYFLMFPLVITSCFPCHSKHVSFTFLSPRGYMYGKAADNKHMESNGFRSMKVTFRKRKPALQRAGLYKPNKLFNFHWHMRLSVELCCLLCCNNCHCMSSKWLLSVSSHAGPWHHFILKWRTFYQLV